MTARLPVVCGGGKVLLFTKEEDNNEEWKKALYWTE